MLIMLFVFLFISVYDSFLFQYHSFINLTLESGNKFYKIYIWNEN